ncbi:MAG TPA: 30S ribosome-binding factor RbfA [Deltaproteobacteria bacterium]|nr:MAG: 30S ribosome-binding factor RbfA [Deltaproteobacteria bacterium]HDM76373.1 30S ribosome-binding factor RbfA [Deltaproteobacteria bacterium]
MFENKRSDRVGDLLQREIAELLIRRVKDPRLHSVTITQVKVSRDLRHAWVYYNILSGGPTKDSVEIGLARAHGFIKRELGRRLRLRYLPNIEFLWDDSLDYAAHIEELLKKIKHDRDDTENSGGD